MSPQDDNLNQSLNDRFAQARRQPALLSEEETRALVAGSAPALSARRSAFRRETAGLLLVTLLAVFVMLQSLSEHEQSDAVAENVTPSATTESAAPVAPKERGARETGTASQPVVASKKSAEASGAVVLSGTRPSRPRPASAQIASTAEDVSLPNELNGSVDNSPDADRSELAKSPIGTVDVATSNGNAADIATAQPSGNSATPALEPVLVARAHIASLPEQNFVEDGIEIVGLEDINTSDDEYNPMITADGRSFYFVSNRVHGLGGHDFWSASKSDRGATTFSLPRNLGSTINTARSEGGASISADGQTMYYTVCGRPDGVGDCDLYEAHLTDTGWAEVRNLREINSQYWDTQPSISSDGRVLYFVSNRPGSVGGGYDNDIYVATKGPDGLWNSPRNVGGPINTSQREDSPFILPGGEVLYFSSEGHDGYGGLDFFASRHNESGDWEHPENLGPEFNTPKDERFIALPAAGDVVYFASSGRRGGTDLDLYMARRRTATAAAVVSGYVIDTESGTPMLRDLLVVDSATGEIVATTRTGDETGSWSFVLGPSDKKRTMTIYAIDGDGGTVAVSMPVDAIDRYRELTCDIYVERTFAPRPNLSIPSLQLRIDTLANELVVRVPEGERGETLTITDAWGNTVLSEPMNGREERKIELAEMAEGIYLVRAGAAMAPVRVRAAR